MSLAGRPAEQSVVAAGGEEARNVFCEKEYLLIVRAIYSEIDEQTESAGADATRTRIGGERIGGQCVYLQSYMTAA